MYLQTNTILLLKITTSRGPKKTRLLNSSFSPTITTYQKSKRKNLMHFSNNILAYNIIPSEAAASECVCVFGSIQYHCLRLVSRHRSMVYI
jgi:hypothetical protein